MKLKFLCRILGHKWGAFTCLRCGEIKPEWIEIGKSLLRIAIKLIKLWEEVEEFRERRDREYEEGLEKPESTGEVLKRLGIKREKVKIDHSDISKFKAARTIKPTCDKKKQLEIMWKPILDRLLKGETIKIEKNDYFGKIRGAHILTEARKDMKRLGYNVEVKLKGHGGTIRIKQ